MGIILIALSVFCSLCALSCAIISVVLAKKGKIKESEEKKFLPPSFLVEEKGEQNENFVYNKPSEKDSESPIKLDLTSPYEKVRDANELLDRYERAPSQKFDELIKTLTKMSAGKKRTKK